MARCPTPGQESSQVRSAQSARSYDGIEHPAKPTAAMRSRPRWSSTLLNDFVRPDEYRLRDVEAERFGGLQVDHQLELGRLLDGQIARFSALQDLVDEYGSTAKVFGNVRPVGHEPAGLRELLGSEYCRQAVLLGEIPDKLPVTGRHFIEEHCQGVRSIFFEHCERAHQVVGVSHLQELERDFQLVGRSPRCL